MSLSHLAKMKLQDHVDDGTLFPKQILENNLNLLPKMPDLEIPLNEMRKLIKNLKTGKVAGPDKIKLIMLK